MNQVVNPLNPTLSLQQFTTAKKMVDISPPDVVGDMVVLLGQQGDTLQVDGEKILWVVNRSSQDGG